MKIQLNHVKPNATVVSVGNNTYYFSYNTCIAARVFTDEHTLLNVRLANTWSATTGRHFALLGVKDWPVVTNKEFDRITAV